MAAFYVGLDRLQAAEAGLEMLRRVLFRRVAGHLASTPVCETRIHKAWVTLEAGRVNWLLSRSTCLPLTQTEARFRFGDCVVGDRKVLLRGDRRTDTASPWVIKVREVWVPEFSCWDDKTPDGGELWRLGAVTESATDDGPAGPCRGSFSPHAAKGRHVYK